MEFISKVADIFGLDPRFYPFLNQIYLYNPDETDQDKTKVKFFQDHCADLDCGNCRKIHMRLFNWRACLRCAMFSARTRILSPLDKDGAINLELFKQAIPKLSAGRIGEDVHT